MPFRTLPVRRKKPENRITRIFGSRRIALPEERELYIIRHRRAVLLWSLAAMTVLTILIFGPSD